MREEVLASRSKMAVALTALIVFAVPAADVALGAHGARAADGTAGPRGVSASAILGDGGPEGMLLRLEEAAGEVDGEVPEGFLREVGLPQECRDVRTDGDGGVVGCTVEGDAREVLEGIELRMRGLGWTSVPLGNGEGATFVKEGGSITWVMVTCTQVGPATSVVFRCNG